MKRIGQFKWQANQKQKGTGSSMKLLKSLMIKDFKIQAKRRAALPKYLALGNCDAVVVREDREVPMVLMPLMTMIGILSDK